LIRFFRVNWLPDQPTRSAGSHRVMTYFIFLSTRSSSSPGLAGSRIDPSGLTEFQNYTFGNLFPLLGWLIFLPSNLGRSQFNPYIFIFLWDPDVINFINLTSNILGNSKLSFFINFDHTFFGMVSFYCMKYAHYSNNINKNWRQDSIEKCR
jgi:hypothetical protein